MPLTTPVRQPPKKKVWTWRSRAVRGLVYQLVAVAVILGIAWFLAHNTLQNMRLRGIQSGFDFLTQPAGFSIGESIFAFDSGDTYWKAFLIGVSNTLRVALAGIVLTTLIGTAVGIGRFSRNALIRGLCAGYVECFRNIPILLQLLVWYLLLTEVLPDSTEAWQVGPLFLSKGGLNFPVPLWTTGQQLTLAGVTLGAVLGWLYRRWGQRRFEATGVPRSRVVLPLAIVLLTAMLAWAIGGAHTDLDMPVKGEFAIERGGAITPEFMSVLFGLTFYTAAFVAEVVRAGIQSVPRGQTEAAAALGLSPGLEVRLVVLPQALRVIIPPMTNQYLNLTKNSSLAVAIGYPDVVSIANTSLNQTGRAVECIAIVMLVYLTTSLSTSALMNWYNARAAIQER